MRIYAGLLLLAWIGRAISSSNSVCYQHLGCFRKNGTFQGIMEILPDSPEQLTTTFRLYTRHNRNASQGLDYKDESSLDLSLIQQYKTTYVLVHGYMDIGESGSRTALKSALLDHSDCQVIIVDWSEFSNKGYWLAAVNTELVGRQISRLLDLLRTIRSLDPTLVHLVGFSLGAHVVGFAGKWTRDGLGYLLGRITALDPAGILFEDSKPHVHVWKEDAYFVDVIHTAGGRELLLGEMGMEKAIGHVDFYPNGGKVQPGCPQGHPDCSHLRAEDYFRESVESAGKCYFASVPCPGGYQSFQSGECNDCGQQGCGRMGLPSQTAPGRGTQFLDTNDQPPYCKLS